MGNAVVYRDVDHGFTVVKTEMLQSKELTLREKGLLSYMLSRPDGWDLSIKELSSELNETEYAIRNALKGLQTKGYLMEVRR